MNQEGQKVLLGQCLPPKQLFEEFARNDEVQNQKQTGNKVILTQSESWADMRVNDALKRDSNDSTSDTDAAINDTRLSKPKVQVSLVSPDSMKRKVADAIRAS